jgi:hypothetical protein
MDIGLIGGDMESPFVVGLGRNRLRRHSLPADAGRHAATSERKS